jgi:selenocysteine lyase/cysteine desulfurase
MKKNSSQLNRRNFVKSLAGGMLSGVALLNTTACATAKPIITYNKNIYPKDETFWKSVKDQFPIIKDKIWMNNGTMGPSPYVVQEAMFKKEEIANSTGDYGGYESVRSKLAKLLGCKDDEISLTQNVTNGINIIAQGMKLNRGDEIILTTHEHVGNAVPWMGRAKRDGIVLKFAELGKDANEMLNNINDLITNRTRVIAIPHVTCTQGQVLPAKEICKLGHDKGLLVMLDGAHPAGMFPVDVVDLDCDFYVSCGHKWMMGPKGTGFLFMKKSMYELVEPIFVGAGSETYWDYEGGIKEWTETGHRYDYTTRSAALSVGLEAATDFLLDIGMENIGKRGATLSYHLMENIKDIPNVEMLTPFEEKSRASLVGFRLKNMEYGKLQGWLMENYKIRARGVAESGLNSIRISTHIYNDFDDVNKLIEGVKIAATL